MDPIKVTIPASTTPTLVTVTFDPVITPDPAPLPKLAIGTNIADNEPIQGSALFANVCNSMTGWFGVGGGKVTYDANGYPQSVTGGQAGSWGYLFGYPAGSYTLKWKGPQNGLVVQGKTLAPASDGAGGWTAQLQFNASDRIDFRSPGGISSVQLLSPDAVAGQTFRQAYIDALKPYSVCRLMQPQQTNGSGGVIITDWAKRVTPGQYDQTSRGIAVEYLVELCKAAGVRPWVNAPYGAQDNFITGLAQAFAGFPDAAFEYSNELWNTGNGFQGNQIRNDALKLGKYGTDPNVAGARYHADLTAHMAQLVRAVIPGAKMVFGAQATWNAWAHDGLSWIMPGIVNDLALGEYFQPVGGDPVNDVPAVLATCRKWIDTFLVPGLAQNKASADAYGCGVVAYEGRQSLIPNGQNAPPNEFTWQADINPAQWQKYLADPMRMAQLDPGMGDLIDYFLAKMLAGGMSLFVNEMLISNWGRAGFWGVKQALSDADNVQSQAMARAIAASH
jgi:hypothetical protein